MGVMGGGAGEWFEDLVKESAVARIKVTVERIEGTCKLPMLVGDHFTIDDSKLAVPEGKYICIWALQSMMPIFPLLDVKDALDEEHWINKVKHFQCPDPKGKVLYRLEVVEDDQT
jgi:uncharacterized repeat protein (TIGR04076 family)